MSSTNLKVAFDAEKCESFLNALSDIQRSGIESVILNVTEDKEITINAINDARSVMFFQTLNSTLLENSHVEDNFKFGIFNISEFTSLLRLFKEGCGLTMTPELITIKKAPNSFKYFGCNLTILKEANTDKLPDFAFDFELNEKTQQFTKALSIAKQGFVIIAGDANENKVRLTITDKDLKTNSFETVLDCEVNSPLKAVINKELLSPVLRGNMSSFTVSVSKPMIRLHGKTEHYEETIYLRGVI